MLLKEIITSLMEDAKLYLHQIDDTQYTSTIPILSHSTIGQHTRHFIEFFQCLLQQVPTTIIDYDKRIRNTVIESNPAAAIQAIDHILTQLPEQTPEKEITLISDYGIECANCVEVSTNFRRELIYNIEHTIHHLAIIKIGLLSIAPEIVLPAHFGIAPSTVKHQLKAVASA